VLLTEAEVEPEAIRIQLGKSNVNLNNSLVDIRADEAKNVQELEEM
jgi:hypothetical protein